VPAPKVLLIQLDGLSSTRLLRAISDGTMPTVAELSDGGRRVFGRTSVAPPSTPVFQAALLYGKQRIVHGYTWFDRERGRVCRMDVPEDIARMEGQLQAGSPQSPLLKVLRGASYFVGFLGGAVKSAFTLANGMRPRYQYRTERILGALLRATVQVPREAGRGTADLVRSLGQGPSRLEWDWLSMRVLCATYFEEVSTTFAAADLRRGVPIVFIDYVAYDEAAHRRGPDHPVALEQLARIDGRVHKLAGVARENGYEIMIVSDHGQAAALPYDEVVGRSLPADVYRACASAPVDRDFDAVATRLDEERVGAARVLKWGKPFGTLAAAAASARARIAATELERRWGVPAGEIACVTGGSIAHVYVGRKPAGSTLEDIEARFPHLLPLLERSPAVGLLTVRRSGRGPLVSYRGRRIPLADEKALAELPPFATVGTGVLNGLLGRVLGASTAGDLVIYGAFAQAGSVSFDPEHGSHGGIHPDELDLFVIPPAGIPEPAGKTLDAADLGVFLRKRYGREAA
jgi:Type I phosphodiesterase / nucleotide pyrophosphatase